MNLGVCPFLNTGCIPNQLVYAGFSFLFFHLLPTTEALMPWIVLIFTFVAVTGLFIDSFRLFIFATLALLIRICPRTLLSALGALIIWTIKLNVRR
jgi:hypothetical protein